MRSDLPKVLHPIVGKPLIRHLMETMTALAFDRIIVVIGHKGELVKDELDDFKLEFVWQKNQRGTGHAVLMAEENLSDFNGTILVAAGDVPFLSKGTLTSLIEFHEKQKAAATCLSATIDRPKGYGRIIRQNGSNNLLEIVEEKDADPETKKITEINTGTFCFDAADLYDSLHLVGDDNAQAEYYLTDTIKILRNKNKKCVVCPAANSLEIKGVNSIEELEELEQEIKEKN